MKRKSSCPALSMHFIKTRVSALPLFLIALTLVLLAFSSQSMAEENRLRIGVSEAPPFVIKTNDGCYDGISIHLWREIATELKLDYEYVETDLKGLLNGLQDGSLDAAVAALTVTPDREMHMDFSHPFYSAGLGIAVTQRPANLLAATAAVFSWRFFQALGALLLVLFAVGVIIWLLEHRANPDQFGGKTHEGIGSGFWWSAVTMTTVGYGDKAPVTPWGRAIAVIWMFISVITVSSFTAAIASVFTIQQLGSGVQGPNDLPGLTVASVSGSTSAQYLETQRILAKYYDTPLAAIVAVSEQKADAAVYDVPIMRYLLVREYQDHVKILPQEFSRQNYAIGLPEGSSLREPINRVLLRHTASPVWQETLFKFLGN